MLNVNRFDSEAVSITRLPEISYIYNIDFSQLVIVILSLAGLDY